MYTYVRTYIYVWMYINAHNIYACTCVLMYVCTYVCEWFTNVCVFTYFVARLYVQAYQFSACMCKYNTAVMFCPGMLQERNTYVQTLFLGFLS